MASISRFLMDIGLAYTFDIFCLFRTIRPKVESSVIYENKLYYFRNIINLNVIYQL